MFFIGIGLQCFFMFTSSSTLSYFFRTFSQHGIRTFAVLAYHWKKVCILTCPVTDVTVYCTICWFAPNLLHNFKTAGWLKLGHVLANKGAALGISGRQKSPKIQQEQRSQWCHWPFFGSVLDALYLLRVSQPQASQHPTEWCTEEKHTHRVLV
jgi:hypothetical protein